MWGVKADIASICLLLSFLLFSLPCSKLFFVFLTCAFRSWQGQRQLLGGSLLSASHKNIKRNDSQKIFLFTMAHHFHFILTPSFINLPEKIKTYFFQKKVKYYHQARLKSPCCILLLFLNKYIWIIFCWKKNQTKCTNKAQPRKLLWLLWSQYGKIMCLSFKWKSHYNNGKHIPF